MIPEQSITFENEKFHPESVSIKDPGDELTLDITTSNSGQYKIAICNTEEQIVTHQERTGDTSVRRGRKEQRSVTCCGNRSLPSGKFEAKASRFTVVAEPN